jgi:RND family efflux transporter MFP subunit
MTPTFSRAGALALATLLVAGLQACSDPGHEATIPTPPDPVSVTVSDAWSATAARSFAARVEAAHVAEVATRASGRLDAVPVDVGDHVRAGQVLASVDDADVRARVRAAEAGLALAERTHGRVSRLAEAGAASAQELDEVSAALEAARAALDEATAQSAYVSVRAPFDGVVTHRLADPGDLAVPGSPILRVEDRGAARVVADLPGDARSAIEVGQSVRVSGRGLAALATVSRVVPSLDPASRRFRVEAEVQGDMPWDVGSMLTLEVEGAGGGSLWIPGDAVVERGQLTGVYSVEGDTVRLRWLRLGRRTADAVEVLAGPAGPLTVVRAPGAEVRDGSPVSGMVRESRR